MDLTYKPQNAWKHNKQEDVFAYCGGYKAFLAKAKTERAFTRHAAALAEEAGFVPFVPGKALAAGDKVYLTNRGKNVLLAVIGRRPIEEGVNLVGAHIDAPRLDLKPNPLYEEAGFALLKTHYYGGIKKYQWTTIPLALHGVMVTKDGRTVEISIGDEGDDVCFTITDLLIHLAADQMKQPMSTAIEGENLNILCGSIPQFTDEDKQELKPAVLALLHEKYGVCEEDFLSAELEIVPAFAPKDIGFDRGIVGAYGHDDRVCSYAAMTALFDAGVPEKTAVCLLVDKEEIGSVGDTGMRSAFFEYAMAELCESLGQSGSLAVRRALYNSVCLSADVCAALDPTYPGVMDKRNAPVFGGGVTVMKYSGSRGKSGANDASAELMGRLRSLFHDQGVTWQVGELGKVDQGGGGTIAAYVSMLGMQVADCGTGLLCMHSPFELASKVDIYETYKAYRAFYQYMQ